MPPAHEQFPAAAEGHRSIHRRPSVGRERKSRQLFYGRVNGNLCRDFQKIPPCCVSRCRCPIKIPPVSTLASRIKSAASANTSSGMKTGISRPGWPAELRIGQENAQHPLAECDFLRLRADGKHVIRRTSRCRRDHAAG